MLVPFAELVAVRRLLGAFTCYDLETARGVLTAAEDAATGVVLLVSASAFAARGGDQLAAGLVAAARRSGARACVQLDHVDDLDAIADAFEVGCGAVMADGSRLPLDDNVALATAAGRIARDAGGSIEVELGHVSGDEDRSAAASNGWLTDPAEVEDFVRRTQAACLAVSIGNVHGEYRAPPVLDWDRLEAIRAATDVALSLHGASGVRDENLRRAVALGITKVNVNTDLRQAYLDATAGELPRVRDGLRLLELHERQAEAVRAVVAEKLA